MDIFATPNADGSAIPQLAGDLFEYVNFQQRYKIDGPIARALKLPLELFLRLPSKHQCPVIAYVRDRS